MCSEVWNPSRRVAVLHTLRVRAARRSCGSSWHVGFPRGPYIGMRMRILVWRPLGRSRPLVGVCRAEWAKHVMRGSTPQSTQISPRGIPATCAKCLWTELTAACAGPCLINQRVRGISHLMRIPPNAHAARMCSPACSYGVLQHRRRTS